jgi:hypothetical protein
MALTDDNGMVMPVSPMYGGGYGGNGFGFGGDWAWIILLILLSNGGWGFGGFGMGGAMGMGMMDGMMLYPWMNQAEITNDGFRDQMMNNNITSIRDAVSGISTQLCNGFAGVNAGVANGFAQAEIAANGRQMASMNQNFGLQTSMLQGFNALGSQFADCFCENRLANCQTQNIIQNEGNATRFADANNTRDILEALNGGIQSIKDQLCADKIDAKNDEIAQLRQEVLFARGQASQDNQTAVLRQSDATTANQLIAELRSCPIPSMPVYGQTPIFTCNGNNGCGCGCGA